MDRFLGCKRSTYTRVNTVTSHFKNESGLKKMLFHCPGQVDFPSWQVTCHYCLLDRQGITQVICQLNNYKSKPRLAQDKQNFRVACPRGKLEFTFFSPGECMANFGRNYMSHIHVGLHPNANEKC